MTSAYGKNNYDRFMQTEIAKGNLLYDIDRGIIKKLTGQGYNYLDASTSVDTTSSDVSTSNNIIPQNEEKLQGQNEKNTKKSIAPITSKELKAEDIGL